MEVGLFLNMDVFPAQQILKYAAEGEKSGFDMVWLSDHFHPWFNTEAHEGFAWVLMASILERTKSIPVGTCVTSPIYRYHPAIIAEAFATLDSLYPNRVTLGLGLGEAMNEVPLGYQWPALADERIERFEEAVKIIKLLWTRDFVTYKGKYFTLNKANLYDKPSHPIPICIASNGPKMTKLAGKYADSYFVVPGLMSENRSLDTITEKLFSALEEGAKEVGRDPSKIKKCATIGFSFNRDFRRAVKSWRKGSASNLVPNLLNLNVYDPRWIEALGYLVSEKELVIVNDMEEFIKTVKEYARVGITHLQIGPNDIEPEEFIRRCGKELIPAIKDV